MNKDVPITVLMSVHNSAEFLSGAIESILQQTYKDFEFIIIDDGSTDGSGQITKKYAKQDNRIRIIQKKNTGLTDSLNVGLRQACGEWIARLDADDIALPDRLRDQLNFVETNKGVSLLGGGCIEIDKSGMDVKKHYYPSDHNNLMNHLRIIKKFFPHSSAFFNRQIVLELGGYNPRFTRSQDRDLWLLIGEVSKIACLDVPVVKLRKHSCMISNADGGQLQRLMGMCAVICHLRRKAGQLDTSKMKENQWEKFLVWVGQHMEEEGVFQEKKSWQSIRDAYYTHKNNKFNGTKAVANYLIKNPKSLKGLWLHFFKPDYASKLAKKSKIIW